MMHMVEIDHLKAGGVPPLATWLDRNSMYILAMVEVIFHIGSVVLKALFWL